ncbi:amidohydrolase [Colwellia sp. MEBiC06753]
MFNLSIPLVILSLSFTTFVINANTLQQNVKQDEKRLISLFQQLHQNPELAYMEFNTAALIAKQLNELGYDVKTEIARTGVVGILKNGQGPTVAIRADMDGLPIKETTDLDYASTAYAKSLSGESHPVMHGCGHDAHVTWLLGVARQMVELKEQWQGTLVLIAQPAEEVMTGAESMVEDGLSKIIPPPDYLVSAHTIPLHPAGTVALKAGPRMAATTNLDVTIHGVGGHGSMPHVAIDPVVMGSMAVMGYQTIRSRQVDQSQKATLTVGAFNAGERGNIIPDQAKLRLNMRWYRKKERDVMVAGVKRVSDNVAATFNVPEDKMPEYEFGADVEPVYNDSQLVELVKPALVDQLGEKRVVKGLPPVMGSEDFHMLAKPFKNTQTLLMEVGVGPKSLYQDMQKGIYPAFNHNPNFKVELDAIATGTEALSAIALKLLKPNK